MTSRIAQWTLDVRDVDRMARFWSAVLGYRIDQGDDGCAKLFPPAGAPAGAPTVWLQHVESVKRGKNRNHPDLNVTGDDPDREVERLLALGARHVDVGQTDRDPFVVLADPEGNEFCVLRNPARGRSETS